MSDDDRQLVPREPEPRRVEATADDVTLGSEAALHDDVVKRMQASFRRAEDRLLSDLLYGRPKPEQADRRLP
jgi:hypothetical protein